MRQLRLAGFQESYMYQDLRDLQLDLDGCTKCTGAILSAKNYPFKSGFRWVPRRAKVMFVAQDPPASGRYLYDGTNERFSRGILKLLRGAGLVHTMELEEFTTAGFYLTDILKCPGGRIKNCKEFLEREIRIIDPELICTLGKKAVSAFLVGKQFKMEECVGDFLPPLFVDQQLAQGTLVFCSYFPMKYPVSDKVKIEHFTKLARYIGERCL